MNFLLNRSIEMNDDCESNPITSVIVVADRNKCPQGFLPITKTFDEQADADLWRESSFTFFSRPVRYLAVSREVPVNTVGAHVVSDLCVVRESDPIPMGFIAIDYTADSKEKALRKKYLCVRSLARDSVVDAVGEIILLSKQRKPPRNFSVAGEIDGILVCFKHVVIPATFGIGPAQKNFSNALYPSLLDDTSATRSIGLVDKNTNSKNIGLNMNALTIKSAITRRGVDDVPFKLNSKLERVFLQNKITVPELNMIDKNEWERQYEYNFSLERNALQSS